MDVDVTSRPGSSRGDAAEGAVSQDPDGSVNSRGKIQVDESGGGFCRPGEDCEDCA